jgi:tetratricopeptide (TPR) repeat protein
MFSSPRSIQPALTSAGLLRKVRRIVGLTDEWVPGRGQAFMRRRAMIAGWRLWLSLLLATQAGCSWLGLRRDLERERPSPEQAARNQQLSEHAQAAIDRGDYEQALVELLQLVAATPSSAEAQQRLGTVLQLQGRLSEAEVHFRTALRLDPDYVEALIGLGQVEALRGDSASALKRFETAIEIDPTRPKGHFSLARMLEALGDTDRAMSEYFKAVECEPNNPETSLRIAAIQLARNQPDQALSRLDQVVELSPNNGQALDLRGLAHLRLRHLPQAIADFRAAAGRLPSRPDVYYHLALALEADHRSADALRAAQQALRLAPDYADARALAQRLAMVRAAPGRTRPVPGSAR